MRVSIKTGRILLLFWWLLLASGINPVRPIYSPDTLPSHNHSDTSLPEQVKSNLYSPETLKLPDALVSPIPSFQFGFVESVACFLFILFCLYVPIVIKEIIHCFTSSYFHTLFSSLILINAP
ncbi:hypothetical protein GXP67_34105 [Rhodocytophaga rosea]|uniref:Uncharacterized protein n=1 Tax=Rhodocytophaga rosea TaxID=2704465 RepID=A0A6C0GT50_9BACT|nr:hypothetical protein [Rhodocytophaga rosea]QHT71335.1 hypothetical protein GXP67_34105 [Rhodocytophaga rosea]